MARTMIYLASLLFLVVSVAACSKSLPRIVNTQTAYEINVEFVGSGFNNARKRVFLESAQRWMRVITGDLAAVTGELPETSQICGFQTPAFEGTVDDLLIYASITPIDGVGKVLGQAGPALIRGSTNDLTVVGCMQFDEADVEALEEENTLDEVVLHEMGHVLGYGSLWEPIGANNIDLLDQPCRSGAVAKFEGSQAKVQFGILGQSGNVPVEDNYGQGTRCSHWDEGFFDNELMTGFLGGVSSTKNPFSALTIAAMADMGYKVDISQAEDYTIPSCSPTCDASRPKLRSDDAVWEIILEPKGTLTPAGEMTFFEQ